MLIAALTLSTACPTKSGEEGHEGHIEEGHEGHGEEGHEEHGEEGHEGHHDERGRTVKLAPEALARIEIEVQKAAPRSLSPQIRTTARVDYDRTRIAHVGPRVPGRVTAVSSSLGGMVEAGDVLATLDSVVLGETMAEHRSAAADEELARKTLERERALLAEKLTSEQQVLEAEAAHKKALAAQRAAADQLRLYGGSGVRGSTYKLRAPIAGKVVEMHLTLGELVTPEDQVFTVADLSALWIWVDIFERDLARVHIGDDAMVLTDAYGSEVFTGKVAYIMDEVDADTRTARARIDIANAGGKLKPGMFAEVTLSDPHAEAGVAGEEVVTVPPSAVLRDGEETVVFVRTGEGEFERREIETGIRTGEFVEVRKGLKAGEEAVTKGGFLLKSEVEKGSMGGGHSH